MLFIINVVIAVATIWNAAEDHSKACADVQSSHGSGKSKSLRKLILLWLVPVLSVAALPLTWRDQTESEAKIAEARRQAALANERTATNESARVKLEMQVEDIRSKNAELVIVGERAKESAALASEAAEKAKAEREKAEAGRLELEKQVLALVSKTKTRMVGKRFQDELSARLATTPKGSIEIVCFDKDPESVAFGSALRRSLAEAGFSVTLSPRSIFNLDIIPGIVESGVDLVFCVKDPKSPPPYSLAMLYCLRNDGIKAHGWPYNESLASDSVQIWVCPKAASAPEK